MLVCEALYQVKHSKLFVFLTSQHFHCIRSLHHQKYVAALLSDQSGWQNISRIELGSSSLELSAASKLELEVCRGLICKQMVIERSNQSNFHNFFCLLKKKESQCRDYGSVQEKN